MGLCGCAEGSLPLRSWPWVLNPFCCRIDNYPWLNQNFAEFYGRFEAFCKLVVGANVGVDTELGVFERQGSDVRSHSAGDWQRWIAEVRFRDDCVAKLESTASTKFSRK